VFNVRSTVTAWLSLIIDSQTELMINTHVTVVNTHTLVSDVHHDVASTHIVVSDICRDMLKREEGTDGQHRAVSDTHALTPPSRHLSPPRFKTGQRFRLPMDTESYV